MLQGQSCEQLFQQRQAASALQVLQRRRARIGQLCMLFQRVLGASAPLAQCIEGGIACNLQQPGVKARFGSPSGKDLIRLDENFLSKVSSFVGATVQPANELEHARLMPLYQSTKSLAVARCRLLDEFVFSAVHSIVADSPCLRRPRDITPCPGEMFHGCGSARNFHPVLIEVAALGVAVAGHAVGPAAYRFAAEFCCATSPSPGLSMPCSYPASCSSGT